MRSQAAHVSDVSHTSYRYALHCNDIGRRSCSSKAGGLKRWTNFRHRRSWFSVRHTHVAEEVDYQIAQSIQPRRCPRSIPVVILVRESWWGDVHRKSECEKRICEWLSRRSALGSRFPTPHCQREGCEESTRMGTYIAAISIPWNENAACTITDTTPRNRSNWMLFWTRCARANTPGFFQYYPLLSSGTCSVNKN